MIYNIDTPLFQIPSTPENPVSWTVRNAVEGTQIFGGIGSGKSSGSGRYLAIKFLQEGFGGLVLTVKPDERAMWEEYCRLAGRTNDLIIIEPNGKYHFNFIDYESTGNDSKSATENIVQVLKTVIRASETKSSGKSDDPFWENALDMLLFNVIDLCKLAFRKVSIESLFEIVQSIPKLSETQSERTPSKPSERGTAKKVSAFELAMNLAKKRVEELVQDFVKGLSDDDIEYLNLSGMIEKKIGEKFPEARLYYQVESFFTDNYRQLSDKTRSIIDFSFSAFLFRLLREPVYSTFCSKESNVTPDDCLTGKIILIDLPVKLYNKVGQDCQVMFKYIWQRAMERRDINANGRPVFLWSDEAQNFLHEYDATYQATARSSRIATVYISQNLPNYNANMGGSHGEYRVKSFLGTLSTKIFHANADFDTNSYASQLIGDGLFDKYSANRGISSGKSNTGTSVDQVFERHIRPEDFALLSTGGPKNKLKSSAILHFQGMKIGEGQTFTLMNFNQNYPSSNS